MGILQNILKAINSAIDNIDFSPYQLISGKNTANGYVGLNSSTKIDSSYLPSYVDDVLEFSNLAGFPASGETGKIYIALDTNLSYRWTGSIYTLVGGDPSLYQLKSEKNSALGYLGLDANIKYSLENMDMSTELIKYNSLSDINDRNSTNITESGNTGASFNANGLAYLTSDTYLNRPTLTISANQGNVGRYMYFPNVIRCNTPYGLYFEAFITGDSNNSILTHDTVVGIGTAGGLITSGSAGSNYGLFFVRNPTLNGGKWRIYKISNGSFLSMINTDIAYQGDKTPILVKIIYRKDNEIAYFYLNNVLIHTMTSVNLLTATNYYPYFCFIQGVTADIFAKTFSLISIKHGLKKYA